MPEITFTFLGGGECTDANRGHFQVHVGGVNCGTIEAHRETVDELTARLNAVPEKTAPPEAIYSILPHLQNGIITRKQAFDWHFKGITPVEFES